MNYIPAVTNGSLNSLFRDFDALTHRVFGDLDLPSVYPRVDVWETEKEYVLEAELPGFSEQDVDVRVKDGLLTIASRSGAEGESKTGEGPKYLIRERKSQAFERSFKLPKDADQETISALYRQGILTLTVGKRPETQPRQITIRTE